MNSNGPGSWKICMVLAASFVSASFAAQPVSPELQAILSRDVSGASDHPLIGRYEGSVLLASRPRLSMRSCYRPDPPGKLYERDEQKYKASVTSTGRITRSIYVAPAGRSSLEVTKNFIDALTSKGFRLSDIGKQIASEGRAVFYGILFDFDKADIKAESRSQLAEMAKFLQSNPSVRAFIVGHTDNKGALDYNVDLSNRRAAAVARALTGDHAIDAKRIVARGSGPLAPVATNRTEDGRAKNRRVELVEQ
jgi:outer membrane protein OmpA-like peptidoglycan-associated protein